MARHIRDEVLAAPVIQPDGLLHHARSLAGTGRGRPPEADLRRGVSAAYYAVFHDLTDRAARHLIGSATDRERNQIRRTWTHGELGATARLAVDRAKVLAANPKATHSAEWAGPLLDLAANDADLVVALRLFSELQERRHSADYDHEAKIDKLTLLTACNDAATARSSLSTASTVSREALFAMLAVRRKDFAQR